MREKNHNVQIQRFTILHYFWLLISRHTEYTDADKLYVKYATVKRSDISRRTKVAVPLHPRGDY